MFSLVHTLKALFDLCDYLLQEKGYSYVLLGKFQTDNLEFRFSQYRQLAGCNYHVSLQQILAGEKKLKLLSVLKLVSASKGTILMEDFAVPQKELKNEQQVICAREAQNFFSHLENSHEIIMTDEQMKVVVFIAGYAAFKL